ncbi:D-alanyl-D-alanine carboxypeptidase family protein [Actinoplanes sp. N902-109]|uniref:M15 family metallopeptidase n=1 Tax=Actinoplanes sp. (strain N902-109) TaxID=649831 RepID=UPI0003296655|nr:M15 family metallopeptidase [Actinoplanes sp. N902-109]AGL17033.1 Curculin domain protein (mannose-binding) lectin [Actinoplanes sp. N902-109]
MTNLHRKPVRLRAAAAVATLAAAVGAVAGPPAPASAAVPEVAQTWASLMYHSLTPTPAYTALRQRLAGQRDALKATTAQLPVRRTEQGAAQTALTTAIAEDAVARTRYAIARVDLATARNTLTVVTQQRPRNSSAVAKAKAAVTAAAKLTATRRGEAATAATALKTAQGTAEAATTALDGTQAALERTTAAITVNQQRLIALDQANAAYAGQAAALSRDVVNQVRGSFTVADSTTVYGIRVHKNVAYAFKLMLDDAKADGVDLSGGGFRTRERQIELRKVNGCPDIYTAPASSCRVPTAIPGRSLHELGLAIDITSGGRTLTAGSAGFKWLSANAGRYGFVNLPSEPWHWSITGS